MLFNSFTFFVFLTLFYALYLCVKSHRSLRLFLILLGSTIFYGWWDWRFLILIFVTGTIDFSVALCMQHFSRNSLRRCFLLFSLICNLGMLSIFKYSLFFAENIERLFKLFGCSVNLQNHIPAFCLILPVGISFYTFQSLSYTIDVYRKELPPTKNYIHFMSYLMFFPQLVAGPIIRAKDLLYRLLEAPFITAQTVVSGVKLIVIGFFKKCFIADNVAFFVNTSFAEMFTCNSSVVWWLTMILFSIQIFCDFSGYSDIARGVAKILGYRFPLNFNHPYAVTCFRDFWRCWHISLSSWFMNYVYIPLGGNVEKYSGRSLINRIRTDFNLFATMLLSGIWHGAAWNFILWGAVHGVFLSFERLIKIPQCANKKITHVIKWMLMLFLIPQTWVFFRAENFEQIKHIFRSLYVYAPKIEENEIFNSIPFLIFFILLELYLYLRPLRFFSDKLRCFVKRYEAVGFAILGIITVFFRGAGNEFIYFQF